MQRKILKALILTFLFAVLALTVSSIALRMALNPSVLRSRIIAEVWERMGRDAGLSQASVSVMRGIVIKDFYIIDPPPSDLESITFAKAVLRVSLWRLIRGDIDASSLELTGPHIELNITPDGDTNLSDVFEALTGGGPEEVSSDSTSEDSGTEESSGESASDGRDGDRPLLGIPRITVRGGSVTINRMAAEAESDRYLDLTDLTLDISAPSQSEPCTIFASGGIGIERQTSFTLQGTVNPVDRSFEGVLRMPLIQDSLVSSLLEFTQVAPWRMTDGELRELDFQITTGPDFTPIRLNGDFDLDEVEARLGFPELMLDGDVDLEIVCDLQEETIVIEELDIENRRSGEDGDFSVVGEIRPSAGEADLHLSVQGLSARNIRNIFPAVLALEGGNDWIDADLDLILRSGFRTATISGDALAVSLRAGVPSLFRSDVDLAGLAVSGEMIVNTASGEFSVPSSIWTLPGVIPEQTPVAMVGSTSTALGLVLPALDWTALEGRLSPRPESESTVVRMTEIAGRLPGRDGGIPVNLSVPAVRTANGVWSDVQGTVRIGISVIQLENLHGTREGGTFSLSGPIWRTGRMGHLQVEDMSLEGVCGLAGISTPSGLEGTLTGVLGGEVLSGGDLGRAAMTFHVPDAQIDGHWLFEELADFLGVEEIRAEEDAEVRVVMGLEDEVWHLVEIEITRPDMRFVIAGTLAETGTLDMVVQVMLAPQLAARHTRDRLIAQAPTDGRGWSVIPVQITSTLSRPRLAAIDSQAAQSIVSSVRTEAMARLFQDLLMEPPPLLSNLVAQPPRGTPPETAPPDRPPREERPERLDQPSSPSSVSVEVEPLARPQIPDITPVSPQRESTTPEAPSGPQVPPPGERRGEIDL